jgi:uncharacterized protein (DUF486 family)
MNAIFVKTAVLLAASNFFMTFIKLEYLWASLCVVGALYFMFRAQS